jgi:hypothetical protein
MGCIYYVKGTLSWIQIHKPDEKYKTYSVCLEVDETNADSIERMGFSSKIFEDKTSGKKMIRFRRPHKKLFEASGKMMEFGPPEVLYADGVVVPKNAGLRNGTVAILKIDVYGENGARLEALKVLEPEWFFYKDVVTDIAGFNEEFDAF